MRQLALFISSFPPGAESTMTIFTIENLYHAHALCMRNKKKTVNALKFEMCREKNLFTLLHELRRRTYRVSRYVYFAVMHPAPREIFAADFRDRVVHHLLCNELQPLFEKTFVEHSFANRKGRGTHKAVKKLKFYLVRGGRNGRHLYFLKMDIKGFFRSIDKNILWKILEKKVRTADKSRLWQEEVLWLTSVVLYTNPVDHFVAKGNPAFRRCIPREKSLLHTPPAVGLPLGNLTSQLFSNIYLDALDHFVVEELGITRYVRYVDDFVILDESSEYLEQIADRIREFLAQKLNLALCEDKTLLRKTSHGIDFLGYYVKPSHTLVRRKVVRRFKYRLQNVRSEEDGLLLVHDLPMVRSYEGHFMHAHSYNLRKKLLS